MVMTAEMIYPTERGIKLPNPSFSATMMKDMVTIVMNIAGMSETRYQRPLVLRDRKTVTAQRVTMASTWLAQEK